MKKIVAFLMAALIINFGVANAGWVALNVKHETGEVVYIQEESVGYDGVQWQVRLLIDNIKESNSNAISMKQLVRFNCDDHTNQRILIERYDGRMGGGTLLSTTRGIGKEYTEPDSVFGLIAKGLCK